MMIEMTLNMLLELAVLILFVLALASYASYRLGSVLGRPCKQDS